MAFKKKFLSTRTSLIIVIVLLVVGLGYVVISNLPPSVDFLTPKEVLSNPETYINQSITLKGYLDKNTEELPIITNSMDTTKARDELRIDYSKVTNRDNLREGKVYYFTGVIKRDFTNPFALEIYLELTEFDDV